MSLTTWTCNNHWDLQPESGFLILPFKSYAWGTATGEGCFQRTLTCCTTKWTFPLSHLRASKVRTKRIRPPSLRALVYWEGYNESEKWKQREQDHRCTLLLMFNLPPFVSSFYNFFLHYFLFLTFSCYWRMFVICTESCWLFPNAVVSVGLCSLFPQN